MIKLTSLLRQVLSEGGNVFGTTASIRKENIESTLEKFSESLGRIFPEKASTFKAFEKLGSAGKKDISGDIDLSYPSENLIKDNKPDLEGWGLDPQEFQQRFEVVRKKARTSTEAQSILRAMLEMIADKINKSSEEMEADPKGASGGSIFCAYPQYNEAGEKLPDTAQVDINVGNPEWLKFSYYSNIYKGVVKGLHRTQLMLAMFTNKGKMFKHESGVLDKETREVEATNPTEALALLNKLYGFEPELTRDIINDYFELSDFLKKQLPPEEYKNLMKIYLKILDFTGPSADIPEDLQDFWIQNQDEFDLKGKYLPQSSNLYIYKK